MILTKENIIDELREPGTLMKLLEPEQFADERQVAYELAKEYVYGKKKEMKTTQLRKVFHALKEKERELKGKAEETELDQNSKNSLRLFIPELAYARGRDLIPKGFYDLMRLCLSSDKLVRVGDLRVLMQFLTALLAYYKYHEKVKKEGEE